MAKKKAAKKASSKKKVTASEDKPKHLEPNEALRLEIHTLKQQLFKEKLNGLTKDRANLELQHCISMRDLADRIKDAQAQLKACGEEYLAEADLVRHRLGIEGKFGFDPDSLEIVQD